MKSKFKKFISNPWTIAILSPIITAIIVACYKKVNIIEAIQLILNFLLILFTYKISIWVIVLSLAIIVFVLYCYIKITNISEEKEPEWLKYTHDTYKKWHFKWAYVYDYGKYRIDNIQPTCSCGCSLIHKDKLNNTYFSNGILFCPNCKKTYDMIDNDTINEFEAILLYNIKSKRQIRPT